MDYMMKLQQIAKTFRANRERSRYARLLKIAQEHAQFDADPGKRGLYGRSAQALQIKLDNLPRV